MLGAVMENRKLKQGFCSQGVYSAVEQRIQELDKHGELSLCQGPSQLQGILGSIHPFDKNLLNTCYVLESILWARHPTENKKV